MLQRLSYLQDSELVARFQRRCGLVLVEAARSEPGGGGPRGAPPEEGGPETPEEKENSEYKENSVSLSGSSTCILTIKT